MGGKSDPEEKQLPATVPRQRHNGTHRVSPPPRSPAETGASLPRETATAPTGHGAARSFPHPPPAPRASTVGTGKSPQARQGPQNGALRSGHTPPPHTHRSARGAPPSTSDCCGGCPSADTERGKDAPPPPPPATEGEEDGRQRDAATAFS